MKVQSTIKAGQNVAGMIMDRINNPPQPIVLGDVMGDGLSATPIDRAEEDRR